MTFFPNRMRRSLESQLKNRATSRLDLWVAKRSAVTKNGALLGGVGLNTIAFSIQHEDLGGQEPEGSWSSHVYIKDRRKVDPF